MRDTELAALHPNVRGLMRYFAYEHLPPKLRDASRPFAELARQTALRTIREGADGPETTVALRKLLEAKDAAVRALVVADQ